MAATRSKIDYFLSSITYVFGHYLQKYKDFIILGDFNKSEKLPIGKNVKDFWNYCKPYFTN